MTPSGTKGVCSSSIRRLYRVRFACVRAPVAQLEDALNEGVCEGQVRTQQSRVRFSEVPQHPVGTEWVGEGIVLVEYSCNNLGLLV